MSICSYSSKYNSAPFIDFNDDTNKEKVDSIEKRITIIKKVHENIKEAIISLELDFEKNIQNNLFS